MHFATAYACPLEDFNKLEAAKKRVDSTLTELQTTKAIDTVRENGFAW